jgi:hypothetical protein
MREMFLVDTGGPHTGVSGAGGDGLTTRSDVAVPRAMGFLPQASAATRLTGTDGRLMLYFFGNCRLHTHYPPLAALSDEDREC